MGTGLRQLILAAAVAALLVTGLWWIGTSTSEPELPSEPAPSIPDEATVPAASWQGWVASTGPLEVQLCLTRTVSNLSAGSDELLAVSVSRELDQAPEQLSILAVHRPSQRMLTAIYQHPDADPDQALQAEAVAAAFTRADEQLYDSSGQVSDTAAAAITEFLTTRVGSALFRPDPAHCWLETDPGVDSLASLRNGQGDSFAVQCLAAAQLDHAASVAIDDPDFVGITRTATQSLTLWYDPAPRALIDLDREAREAELQQRDQQIEALGTLRLHLAEAELDPSGDCPFSSITYPSDLSTNTNTNTDTDTDTEEQGP